MRTAAPGRRRGEDADVLQPDQGGLQRARDRRRGHGEDVRPWPSRRAAPSRRAEALLLVDHHAGRGRRSGRPCARRRCVPIDDVDARRRPSPAFTALRLGCRAAATGPPTRARCRRSGGGTSARCWRASTVVGATTATCLPHSATAAAARSAISVLPKPTSPQTSRSIGRPEARSARTAAMARAWSGVSVKGKRAAKRSNAGRGGASAGALACSRSRASPVSRRALSAMAASTCARRRSQDLLRGGRATRLALGSVAPDAVDRRR